MSDTKQKTASYEETDTRAVKDVTNVKKMSWQRRSQAITRWAFMALFVILFTVVFLVSILIPLYSGFFRLRTVGGGPYGGGEIQNIFVELENYQYAVTSPGFWKGIGRVVLCTCFQVPMITLMTLVLASLLDSLLTRHVTTYRLGYFLPLAIPGVVTAMIQLYLYNPEVSPLVQGLHTIGLPVDFFNKNVILASVANMTTWIYTGYDMLIFLAALQAIPAELSKAVRINGASGLQVMTRTKVPMPRGAALLTVLPSTVETIQLFNEPRVMSSALPWMGKSYTPMMVAYNTTMGTLTPSGGGPGSAIAIVIALTAGVLAVGYFLVGKKVDGNG